MKRKHTISNIFCYNGREVFHMQYDELRQKIDNLIDPSFKKTFKEVKGIKKLTIGPTGIVELEMYLKNKREDEAKVKIEMIKLVKVDLGFPGIKLSFFDSEFVPEGETKRHFIQVVSGKGGVGKSSVTVNLAYALKKQGHKVGIIDADIYGSSIPNLLKMNITPLESTKDEKMIPLKHDDIQIVSTEFFMPKDKPLMWRGPMLGKMLVHYFTGVEWDQDTDMILIDLPPGTGDVALDINMYVPKSDVIVVTTPHHNASDIAVKAGLGAQQIGHTVLGVVENMSYFEVPHTQEKIHVFGQGGGAKVAKTLGTTLLASIPIASPDLGDIYQNNALEEAYIALAQALEPILK
jgi:ATP-binding protein involved in chromosome partitioning